MINLLIHDSPILLNRINLKMPSQLDKRNNTNSGNTRSGRMKKVLVKTKGI